MSRVGWLRKGERVLRRVLPRSFMGRSLLIVLIPLLVTQAIVLGLFYGHHLHTVSRRLADSVTGEISLGYELATEFPARQAIIFDRLRYRTQIALSYQPGATFIPGEPAQLLGPVDDDLRHALAVAFQRPFRLDWNASTDMVQLEVSMPHGVLTAAIPRKRLDVEPIWLFVVWAAGSSALLFVIASIFIRNQVRALRRLTASAESFGLGRDSGPIEPRGALELRRAAVAFNRMQARVTRFVAQRTAVLAGVSHDLRTPLTRLRLTIAMLPADGQIEASELKVDVDDMAADIAEMERLIGSYLSFARGEGAEEPVSVDLCVLVDDVAQNVIRAGGEVMAIHTDGPVFARVRPDAMRRVLVNLAENARRHGGRMAFSVRGRGTDVEIVLDDDGPGIVPSRRRQVFRAYDSAGPAGGNGLGLTIVRDIMHAHGGSIRLLDSPLGGLRVVLTLPA